MSLLLIVVVTAVALVLGISSEEVEKAVWQMVCIYHLTGQYLLRE